MGAPSNYRPSQLPRRFPGWCHLCGRRSWRRGRAFARYRSLRCFAWRTAVANQRYAAPVETIPMTSTSLAELLDPDKWIASGKNLTDFPWPDGANEREAMKLILCARPMLNAHVCRAMV